MAEYMLGWLESRDARLFSEELVRMHERLVPQEPPIDTPMDTAEKINFLLARQEGSYLAEFALRLQRIAVEEGKTFEVLECQSQQTTHRLQSAQTQLEVIQAEEQRAHDRLQARMEEHMHKQLQARSAPATAANAQTMARLNHLDAKAQQALEQLKQKRESLQREITQLEQENGELKISYGQLAEDAQDLNQKAILLKQTINETKIAIKKAKRHNVLEAIAWTAGSIFGTWAIQAWISTSMSVTFDAQMLRSTIRI
jgi:hypothetical protein